MIRFVVAFCCALLVSLPVAAQIKIEEVTSPGGIKAWLVNEPSIPFIALKIAFRGGTSLDRKDALGAVNLMAGLLEEGTGEMDAAAYRRASESLAANFSFNAGRDSVDISAEVLKSNADQAFDLLKQALVSPAFNETAIERVRGQVISGIESALENPESIAEKTMSKIAFGDHPYGRPSDGTIESVTALTRDDLVAAHKATLSRDHLVIGVVGDVTAAELGPMLDDLLGDLPAMGGDLPKPVKFAAPAGVTVVNFPTSQSVAIWAQDTDIDLQHPDFMAAYVMNHILGGGGFGSRLTEEVREKRGLTYGVYSYLNWMEATKYMGGSVASANGTIGEAIDVVRAEWARMATDGVTGDELEKAKKYLTGSYALRFDGNSKIARILVSSQMDHFPIDYANTRNDRINAVTLDDVARVAKENLHSEALRFVVVGQPEGVENTE